MLFAQNKILKAARKAVRKGDILEAKRVLVPLEKEIGNLDSQSKASYYYIAAQILERTDPNALPNIEKAGFAYKKILTIAQTVKPVEGKSSGLKIKEAQKAQQGYDALLSRLNSIAEKHQTDANFDNAVNTYMLAYSLSPSDTLYLYKGAVNSLKSKDYQRAYIFYKDLMDMGYKGGGKFYTAIDKKTRKETIFKNKEERDKGIRSGKYFSASMKQLPSKRLDMISDFSTLLYMNGECSLALDYINKELVEKPKNQDLLLKKAQMSYCLGDQSTYESLLLKSIASAPSNCETYLKIGNTASLVNDVKRAKFYYNKAISIKPKFLKSYVGLVALLLKKEQSLIAEILQEDSKKVKQKIINDQQKPMYLSVVPYLESVIRYSTNKKDAYSRQIHKSSLHKLIQIYEYLDNPRRFHFQRQLEIL